MASASSGEVGRHLRQLFDAGSVVGLSDGELLERFAASRRDDPRRESAESAFEAIVARHGPAVLSVCRQVLGDNHAAEDAFQATFLVLVRRAGSLRLRNSGSLGSWLYGVAYRTALKARKGAMRRRTREQRVAIPESRGGTAVVVEVERADLASALHAEVARLPAKYRAPLVLCYFEGRSNDEAAGALNWPVGTVRCRLSRGREMLRKRLIRRGLTLSVATGLAAGESWAASVARAEVPAHLVRATLESALAGSATVSVAATVRAAIGWWLLARWRTAAMAAALGLVAIASAVALTWMPAPGGMPASPPARTVAATTPIAPAPPDAGEPAGGLPAHARTRLGTDAFRHGSLINQVLTTRDGKTVVTADIKRVVYIWDAATGRLRHRIPLAGQLYEPIVLSPDGSLLLTGEPNPDHRFRVWDVASGRERARMRPGKDDPWITLAFLPDGRTVILFGRQPEGTTRRYQSILGLWDLVHPDEPPRRLVGPWTEIGLSRVAPDGTMLAGFGDATEPTPPPVGALPGAGMSVTQPESVLRIVEFPTRRERASVRLAGKHGTALEFAPDSRHLAVALDDGTVRVFSTADGRERSPRMASLASTAPRVDPGDPAAIERREVIGALAFSSDGSTLAGGSCLLGLTPSPGSLYLWDFARGTERRRIGEFRTGPGALAFAPDGRTIAAAVNWEPVMRVYQVANGREALPRVGHASGVGAVAVSPADGTIFTASFDGAIHRWDPASGIDLGLPAGMNAVVDLAIAPDGRSLVACGPYGDPLIISVPDGDEIRHLPGQSIGGTTPRQIAWSPDGRAVGFGRTIRDASSGKELVRLRIPGERENSVSEVRLFFYFPDGRRAITVEKDVARTWDVATGAEASPPLAIVGERVAISADGRFLATGGFANEPVNARPPD
ncbi:MAG: sigma-70 family RNA polymerase sigma factor, partial [Isosphaeraceae bacterium]